VAARQLCHHLISRRHFCLLGFLLLVVQWLEVAGYRAFRHVASCCPRSWSQVECARAMQYWMKCPTNHLARGRCGWRETHAVLRRGTGAMLGPRRINRCRGSRWNGSLVHMLAAGPHVYGDDASTMMQGFVAGLCCALFGFPRCTSLEHLCWMHVALCTDKQLKSHQILKLVTFVFEVRNRARPAPHVSACCSQGQVNCSRHTIARQLNQTESRDVAPCCSITDTMKHLHETVCTHLPTR
jgi:hypothetical protein